MGKEKWAACACMVLSRKGRRHTQYSNDLLRYLTAGAHAELLRRLCATKGAFAPLRHEYDKSSRARE